MMDIALGDAWARRSRVARWLLIVSVSLAALAIAAFLVQPRVGVDVQFASVGLTLIYLAWPVLAASVVFGLLAWIRGRLFSWWTVVGGAILVVLTWVLFQIPKAMLS